MPSDRTYTFGGANAEAGNYPRTDGIDARGLRLVTMAFSRARLRRGWLASPTPEDPLPHLDKYDENAENTLRQVVDVALKPLVDEGAVDNVDVQVSAVTEYALGFIVTYTDMTTGDSLAHEIEAPWKG